MISFQEPRKRPFKSQGQTLPYEVEEALLLSNLFVSVRKSATVMKISQEITLVLLSSKGLASSTGIAVEWTLLCFGNPTWQRQDSGQNNKVQLLLLLIKACAPVSRAL